jgi:two-component system, OmpR family, response regulator
MQSFIGQYEFTARSQPSHAASSVGASSLGVTHILIVDGAPGMSRTLVEYFQQQSMDAVSVAGRQNMLRRIETAEPSLVILDLRPSDEDALDLLREIRSRSDVPVIVIMEHRHDDLDRILGLELGADHYLTKPFNPRELLARVRAVLRRQDMARAPVPRGPERGGFRFGDWQLMRKTRRLTDRQGNAVPLTKGQYALLVAFLEAPQRPLTREYLLQATRVHEDIFDRSIDVQVLRLRQKLQPVPTAPRYIRTERGVGYVFAMPVERF